MWYMTAEGYFSAIKKNEPLKHYAKQKKLVLKDYILYKSVYIWNAPNKQIYGDRKQPLLGTSLKDSGEGKS